jgi:hypothetical protein
VEREKRRKEKRRKKQGGWDERVDKTDTADRLEKEKGIGRMSR